MAGLLEAGDIVSYAGRLETERHQWTSTWQDIADCLVGHRDFLTKEIEPGRQRHQTIYDTTALFSGRMLSAGLDNWLTNTATKWFGLKPEDERLLEDDEVRLWFADADRVMNAMFNRPESGFVPAMAEYWSDLVWFGTASLMIEEVPGLPVRFTAIPLSEIRIAEGGDGRIDTVVREFRMTNRQAIQKFARGNMDLARQMVPGAVQGLETGADQRRTYLHLVHPRTDPALRGRAPRTRMAFRSVFLDMERKTKIREGGFEEMPYLVGRWDKDAGETYGRNNPGWIALPNGKMLNLMKKTLIKGAEKRVDPPMQVTDDGVILPLKTHAGAVNVVRMGAFSKEPIKMLPIDRDAGLTERMFEMVQEDVRAAFLHDLLKLLQKRFPTATQVLEITEQAQALASPTVGRQQIETLEPMIERTFNIGRRARVFQPAPEILLNAGLKVEYLSPVQRAQRLSEVRNVEEYIAQLGATLLPVAPHAADNVDWDFTTRFLGNQRSVPPEMLLSAEAVEAQREAQRQLAAEEQEREDLALAASSAGKAAPALQLLQGGEGA